MSKLQLTREHVALLIIFAVITACILLMLLSVFKTCNVETVCANIVSQYESQCVCPWRNDIPILK